MTTDRLPPHNLAAERGVLGAVLRDPDVFPDVQRVIRAEHFYYDANRTVFGAVADLAAENLPLDLVLVHDRLRQWKRLDDVGGVAYLTELWEATPTAANVEYHAKLVRETATARGLIHAANEILRDAYDRAFPADELVATAERRLFDLAVADPAGGDPLVGSADLVRESLALIDQRAEHGETVDGVPTGFGELDEYLNGFQAGQLVVLGARPSVGKTALALCTALNAVEAGISTAFYSVEMPRAEIMQRVFAVRSGVPLRCIQKGQLSGDQASRVIAAAQELGRQPFRVDDTSELSAAGFASSLRRAVRRRGVGLAVVDYLQILQPENPRENRTQQIGMLARRIKQAARGCGVPVLLLCQLNRESDNRTDGRPRLSDLRDSGEIEQHADIVLLLSPQSGPPDSPRKAVDVLVAKNRNGPTGDVTLSYCGPLTRFENYKK